MSKQKNEQSSRHLCHLISEINDLPACVAPLLKILIMAAAAWQLINENHICCSMVAGLNAVLHCHAILLLLFYELIVVARLAIVVVLQLMHWAHDNLGAVGGGLVCEDCGCAP